MAPSNTPWWKHPIWNHALVATVVGGIILAVILAIWHKATSDAAQGGSSAATYATPPGASETTPPIYPEMTLSASSDSSTPVASNSPLSDISSPTFNTAGPSTPVKVALADLCNAPGADVFICGGDYGGTILVGGQLFQYYGRTNENAEVEPPNWGNLLRFPNNTCTKLVIQFAIDDRQTVSGEAANMHVLQTSLPPVTASAPHGTVGTLTAKLDGGPFQVEANSTGGANVLANGYAICTTASGE